jgi:lipopolysaccharide export system protein LptA
MPKKNLFVAFLFTSILLFSVNQNAHAQKVRIHMNAGELRHSSTMGDMTRALNNPVFEHEGAYLYCDSAWLYEISNTMDCYGHVRIKSSDTLNLYGKFLHYDGNTKIAIVRDDVKLVDKQTTLTTDLMYFDRNTNIASYTTGGKMVNGDNILTSKRCYYYTSQKLMYFRDDVVLTNPDYKINCDTLKYNTVSRISYFLGPTILKGKDNYLYCEDGEYDRATSKSRFSINALLVDENRRLTGDSLYYNEKLKYGKAVNHVVMTDTVQDVVIKGNYAEYWRTKGYTLFTNEAVAVMGDKQDTLYLHADTLKATFDTTKNETKELFAYHNARFYRSDIQGACDSLHYSFADSLISMYRLPVIWSGKNQLTADTVRILTGKNRVRQIFMNSTAFIVSKDTTETYNQIRGKNMVGHFVNNELTSIDVNGNAETVYFVREADMRLIGVNKASGSRMRLDVKDSKIDRIIYFDKPTGNMFPDKDVPPEQRMLKGFNWRFTSRPLQKEDVLRNVDEQLYQEARDKAKEENKEPTIEPVKVSAKDQQKVPGKVIKPAKDQDIK